MAVAETTTDIQFGRLPDVRNSGEQQVIGINARLEGAFSPTDIELISREHIARLPKEDRLKLFNANILVLGNGNAGGNIAVECALNGIGLGGRFILVDPDTVEPGNIKSGQPYNAEQAAKRMPKAHALKQIIDEARDLDLAFYNNPEPFNMPAGIYDYVFMRNFAASRKGETKAITYALSSDSLRSMFIRPQSEDPKNHHSIDLVIDAIDISEPSAVYEAHKIAYAAGVPVVTAFDLMSGFKIMSFDRAAVQKRTPLMGMLNQGKIQDYERIRKQIKQSGMPRPEQASALKIASYNLLTDGLITPGDFFPSLAMEVINPTTEPGKTKQLPDTARAMGTRTAAEIADLLTGRNNTALRHAENGVSIVKYDLDRERSVWFYPFKKLLANLAGRLIISQVTKANQQLLLQYD